MLHHCRECGKPGTSYAPLNGWGECRACAEFFRQHGQHRDYEAEAERRREGKGPSGREVRL